MRRNLLIAGIAIILAADGLVLLAAYRPAPFQWVRLALSRHPACSLSDVTVYSRGAEDHARGERIMAGARRVRSEDGLIQLQTSHGLWWVPDHNESSLGFMLAEVQDRDYYGERGRGVKAGDVVLDCGANVGIYARHALNRGAALVVAVEPAPENIECLRRNFAEEIRTGRVIVYPKGVWDKEGSLQLQVVDGRSLDTSVVFHEPDSHPGATVPLTTIDHLVADLKLERVSFLKMDIEGAERQALSGARETLRRFRPRMAITLEHFPDDSEVLSKVVRGVWEGAQLECGSCTRVPNVNLDRVQPEVLYVF